MFAARADSLSYLQNLGKPLSRIQDLASQLPGHNPIPSVLDMSLDAEPTRTKKCCKDAPPIDRIQSEWYPIEAPKDLRYLQGVFGAPSRLDGRDPIAYSR